VLVPTSSRRSVYLREVATVVRGYESPARFLEENIHLFMGSLYEAVALVVLVSLLGFWEWRSALPSVDFFTGSELKARPHIATPVNRGHNGGSHEPSHNVSKRENTMTANDRTDLDELSINTMRTLAIDAIQQAKSGHPGTPCGA
jgi:Transketolase, thiamine diphosphate binding domain